MKIPTLTTGFIDINNCLSIATNRKAFDRIAIQKLEAITAIEQIC